MSGRLRALVASLAIVEGRNETLYPGLRCYRFSGPTEYRKTQVLAPGIVLVLQGQKLAKFNGYSLAYDALNCLVLARETSCQGTVVEASPAEPYLAVHLDLPPATLVKTFVALAAMPHVADPVSGPAQDAYVSRVDPRVREALTRLLLVAHDPVDCRLIAPLVVEEIVVRLLRSDAGAAVRGAAGTRRNATGIQRAIEFIQQNFAEALSVDRLARVVAMSPSHFAHSFREVSGVSPMRYVRDVRLDQARALMLGSGMRAGKVAEQVGFTSAAHFSREFKSRFDATPTAYARRMVSAGRSSSQA